MTGRERLLHPREDEWIIGSEPSLADVQERLWWKHERMNSWFTVIPTGTVDFVHRFRSN
jgi:hypothetical protein